MTQFLRLHLERAALALGMALIILTSSSAQAAGARPDTSLAVGVVNDSATCVWVSVAYANTIVAWTWMNQPHNTARFLRPGTMFVFETGAPVTGSAIPVEVKVEGTFMQSPDCSGRHEREITTVKKGIWRHPLAGNVLHVRSALKGKRSQDYQVIIGDYTQN